MKTEDIEQQLLGKDVFDITLVDGEPAPLPGDVIDGYLKERGIKRAELIRRVNLDRNYGYQILNGRRMPTKEQIVLIALYLRLSVEQAQYLLKISGREQLYVRNIQDAKAMYALEHKMDLYDYFDLLENE